MRRRAFVIGLAATTALVTRQRPLLAYPSGAAASQADYTILIGGRECGRHSVTVALRGGRCTAEIRTAADVRILGIPMFRYDHHSLEVWDGETLVDFASRTDDNGRSFRVAGRSTRSGFLVDVAGRIAMLPPDVAPATYWNQAILERPHVLDPEDGRLFRHHVGVGRPAALDWLPGASEAAEVEVTSFMSGVVWYARTGRFLGCRFLKDGYEVEIRALPG